MKGWKTCPVCRGEGVFYDAGDMHKAAGWIPCWHRRLEKQAPIAASKTRGPRRRAQEPTDGR